MTLALIQFNSTKKKGIHQMVKEQDLKVLKYTDSGRIAEKLELFTEGSFQVKEKHIGDKIELIELSYAKENGLISETDISEPVLDRLQKFDNNVPAGS